MMHTNTERNVRLPNSSQHRGFVFNDMLPGRSAETPAELGDAFDKKSNDSADDTAEYQKALRESLRDTQYKLEYQRSLRETADRCVRLLEEELEERDERERRHAAEFEKVKAQLGALSELSERNAALLHRVTVLEAEISEIRHSTSWKVSAPLRFVAGRIPRNFRMFSRRVCQSPS
jgi:hypothetical protein